MRSLYRNVRVAAALVAIGILAGSPAAQPRLGRLAGLEDLKSWFNAGKGHPRLILLLSPT